MKSHISLLDRYKYKLNVVDRVVYKSLDRFLSF